jgi:hypothetical protein
MSQGFTEDAHASAKGHEIASSAEPSSETPNLKPTPLFTAGHPEQPNAWPFVERRQGQRRHFERRAGEDRRDIQRRSDERRRDERRAVVAPVDVPELKREEGGMWPSLDWRAGNRRLDDRRASDRRMEERRNGADRRAKERRKVDRRQGSQWEGQAALDEDIDDLAEAGDYKGGLD